MIGRNGYFAGTDRRTSALREGLWEVCKIYTLDLLSFNRELKQPRQRRQQERHKFTYLTMKNNSFGHCTRIFHFETFCRPVLQLCGRREHLMTDVQFCLLISDNQRCWFQFNSRIV